MKRSDIIFTLFLLLIFVPFFISDNLYIFYKDFNSNYPFLISFIKFAILATLGELLGLRIRHGKYFEKGFGVLPRAIVWGILGVSIKMAFIIFGEGAPLMLQVMGLHFPAAPPSEILKQDFISTFSGLQLLTAFAVSVTMNVFFAPVFMTFHKITDTHILATGGTLRGFFKPIRFAKILHGMNWKVQWNFVIKKTIPFFWIPAQTINFLLPGEYRILVAALLGIVLGVILSIASLKGREG
ncbi:MAG: hypothetical protein B6D61_11990 [Bacteroidetes bacterium 4484_249]|nr:MAG: hypothetical protein B6D61_11990 [Bacteroidetes bacterium 4484_249]